MHLHVHMLQAPAYSPNLLHPTFEEHSLASQWCIAASLLTLDCLMANSLLHNAVIRTLYSAAQGLNFSACNGFPFAVHACKHPSIGLDGPAKDVKAQI